jgi:transglutaminase-like putative cysteine protease
VYVQDRARFQIALAELPDGAQGTRTTLQIMSALVGQFKANPRIWELAHSLTQHLAPKDFAGQVRELHNYVRDQIRYVHDIRGIETVQTPTVTLDAGQGDCDDKATLLATLLESIGHATRFKAIGRVAGEFQHVYVQTPIGATWVSLDTTHDVPAGWEPAGFRTVMLQVN